MKNKLPTYKSPRVSSELPDCSLPLTFDSYNTCSLGCRYCFADAFKENNPALRNVDFVQAVDVNKLHKNMIGEYSEKSGESFYHHFYKRRFMLHWGGLADPFCSYERKYGVGKDIIKMLGSMRYPTLFSFKGKTIFKYLKTFQKYSKHKSFAFQTSIITRDDALAKKIEPGVPSPTKRIETMKILGDMGYWTILRMRPFIIGITDLSLDKLLEDSLAAGIKAISTEFFALDCKVTTKKLVKQYNYIGDLIGVKDLLTFFLNLSPNERGCYCRLNRLIKETYIKKIYKFCCDHDLIFSCSDPDFKELGMSGSCCGLPETYPENPEMCNWSKNQMTYHIKEARRTYHKTGKLHKFYFHEVYGDESYLDDNNLHTQNIGSVSKIYAQRTVATLRMTLLEKWNNLKKSPSNPQNYFNGKVIPIGLDSNGNLIYVYNPMQYEKEWAAEKIDLTR